MCLHVCMCVSEWALYCPTVVTHMDQTGDFQKIHCRALNRGEIIPSVELI